MLPLLAQADPSSPAAPGFLPLPLLMLLMGLFFVVFILPQNRRQRKEQEQMLAKDEAGAKVVLSSGIVGNVVTAKDGEDEITIRSADAKLRVLRSTVTRVVADDATEPKA